MENIQVDTPLQVFNALVAQDENLSSSALTLKRKFTFDTTKIPFENVYDDLKKIDITHPMMEIKLDDGFESLSRRGFYQIVSEIEIKSDIIFTSGQKYTAYKAYVLYADSINADKYYGFNANIGPLVNANAVIFDLSPNRLKKVLKFGNRDNQPINKRNFFENLRNKPFYVSLQQRTEDDHKQTFWFKLN
jgi:cobalamin biosynthesis Co2+ chelatase CbiK